MVVKSSWRVTLTGVESLKQSQDRQCHALIYINPQAARRHQRRDKLMPCLQSQPGVETLTTSLLPRKHVLHECRPLVYLRVLMLLQGAHLPS